MLVKELALGVAIYANVGVQAHYLTAPEVSPLGLGHAKTIVLRSTEHEVLQGGAAPQALGERWVVDLETIVYADGVALFGLAGRGGEGEGG